MITQVTYERLFNLGNYESERIAAVATVEDGDVPAAYDEARTAVESEHDRNALVRAGLAPAEYIPPPVSAPLASEKQIAYIRSLAADLDYTDEALSKYADEHGIPNLAYMTSADASALITLLKKEQREEGIHRWSTRLVTPAEKPGVITETDIPF